MKLKSINASPQFSAGFPVESIDLGIDKLYYN